MRALTILIALSWSLTADSAPLVADFTNYARYESVKISPRGTYLALTQRGSRFETMTVLRLADMKPLTNTQFGEHNDVWSFFWANDTRLLIQPARRFPGFTSYKAPTGEIFGLDADGKNQELLFGYAAGKLQTGTKIAVRQAINAAAKIVDMLPDDKDNVIIQTIGYEIEGEFNSAYRMNVRSGQLARLASSPLRNGRFVTDRQHRVTFVHGVNQSGAQEAYYRKPDSSEWQLIRSSPQLGASFDPLSAFGDNNEFVVLEDHTGPTTGVTIWQPDVDAKRLLFRDTEADVIDAEFDSTGQPWAFKYFDHQARYFYPNPDHPLAKLHRVLTSSFPGDNVTLTSHTDDMRLAVAHVSGPRNPGVFFVADVQRQKLTHALQAYPNLKAADLAVVEPFEVKARDGLRIRGYLTVPNGFRKNLPLVVVVHGGPHGIFDAWSFDYEAQLFASRGYAVLQVNYRGSGGRGREFQGAGYGRWGKEMQDDITDAVRWAITDGVADPKRICIYGASYGGYAALTGAFREPDLFRCAVGFAGVYDLPLMFERGDIQTIERGENYLRQAVGTDVEELRQRSPVYNAESIRAPVMLIHGKLDERAPIEHAERMRAALQRTGRDVEWISETGEAHGFFNESNRVEIYERMLTFFATHLGVGVSP